MPYYPPAGGITDGDKGDITVSGGGTTWEIDAGVITDTEVGAAAAISWSKLATGTANRVMVTNASGNVSINAGVTTTELTILDGATVTTTELNYVSGVTSAIQTQLNAKAPTASPTFTGTVTAPNTNVSGEITITASGSTLPASTTIASASGSTGAIEILSQGSAGTAGASFLTFHRPGAYAVHVGIDTDNQLKIGGWSAGAVSYKVWNESNDGAGSGLDADVSTTQAADNNTTKVATTAFVLGQAASQAELEAASSTTKFTTAGRQQYHPSAAKCWAVVTVAAGAPTLQTSYNITSITDTATGQLTVTIATDFSSANWACVATTERAATGLGEAADRKVNVRSATKAAGSVVLECFDSTATTMLAKDPDSWSMVGFGDQ